MRAQGRLITPEEFGEIVVRANPDGSQVRLKDVARIELGALNYQQEGRYNGKPGGVIAIFQTPGSNALEVAEGDQGHDGPGPEELSPRGSSTRWRSTPRSPSWRGCTRS